MLLQAMYVVCSDEETTNELLVEAICRSHSIICFVSLARVDARHAGLSLRVSLQSMKTLSLQRLKPLALFIILNDGGRLT